ncbi:DUF4359 domain-containing protein [Spirosoma sp. RP8]|uniref:DUF4359 domain-containing protein n=1 Tax=Spirosoma liriopis TaxID=2937440 RepID=A0ABT0HV39_9BACT|nr:DUF4359 domain-containing protein [Spirosoma liriopis]MCK8496064.1 DUF4359 domain-containing protein [Spirosoma liriopis]
MTKQQFSTLIALLAIITLVLTNPREEEHKSAVKAKLNVFMKKKINEEGKNNQMVQGLGALFGGYVVDQIVNTAISRNNYYIFSTTKFSYSDSSKTIGVGVLGNIFFSSKVDKALKDGDLLKTKRLN